MNNVISEVVSRLQERNIKASNHYEDGRVNSIEDEETIIAMLKEICGEGNVQEPPLRHWYDVKIYDIPVQIKSSSGGSDNFSSKKSIAYAFTNLTESEVDGMSNRWQDFDEMVANRRDDNNNRDYDIIVLDKKEGKVYHRTLKTLSVLTCNGSNLPFQINWSQNLKAAPVARSGKEAYKFVMSAYAGSVELKMQQHKKLNLIQEQINI